MPKDPTVYVKLGRDGDVIEREAFTPADHVQFRGTGWVLKESDAGRRVTNPRKSDSVEGQAASSVTAHATAANAGTGSTKPAKS